MVQPTRKSPAASISPPVCNQRCSCKPVCNQRCSCKPVAAPGGRCDGGFVCQTAALVSTILLRRCCVLVVVRMVLVVLALVVMQQLLIVMQQLQLLLVVVVVMWRQQGDSLWRNAAVSRYGSSDLLSQHAAAAAAAVLGCVSTTAHLHPGLLPVAWDHPPACGPDSTCCGWNGFVEVDELPPGWLQNSRCTAPFWTDRG